MMSERSEIITSHGETWIRQSANWYLRCNNYELQKVMRRCARLTVTEHNQARSTV